MTGALIVIPCLDEEEHLPDLLALLRADADADALIVVADGGSRDRSRAIVERAAAEDPRVVLMDNAARIQSAGINGAVRRYGAGRTHLVRIDAHCLYPDDYCSALLAEAERTGADSVVVAMRTMGAGCIQRAVAAAQNSRLGSGNSAHRVGGGAGYVDHGHHAVMRVETFLALGGYDETFAHNEDAEYDHRLSHAGGRIWLSDAAVPIYFPRKTLGRLFRQYRGYGRGRAATVRKHAMRLKPRQVAPAMIAPALGALLLAPAAWVVSPALGTVAALPGLGWVAASLGGGAVLALKARDGCVLCAGVAAMAMHLAWSLGFLARIVRPPAPVRALTFREPAAVNTAVDVCVCTFRRRSLETTLASLAALRLPPGLRMRVIVADNDDSDVARQSILEAGEALGLDITYLHAPARNISTARNAALDAARSPWIAVLDDDEVASPDWLTHLLDTQRTTGADVVLGPAVARYGPDVPGWIRAGDFHSARPVIAGGMIRTGYTSNVLFARTAPALAGRRFDPRLGRSGGEDTHFFHEAFVAGARIAAAPAAAVYEEVSGERATLTWLMRRRFRSGQSHGLVLAGRGLSVAGRAKQIAIAGGKAGLCAGVALGCAWSAQRFAFWSLRAALHFGVVSRLAGVKSIVLYGGDEAVA